MKIVIQRHGEPDIGEWDKISSSEMARWINCYNESGVVMDNKPCSEAINHAKGSFVVCSTLERSKHSAKLLEVEQFITDTSFCEAELPLVSVPLLKMAPHTWSIIFRIFWFLGLAKNVESKKEISSRVRAACHILESLAVENDNVFLIGHGIMNRLIAKELLLNGWSGEGAPNGKKYHGYRYWEYSIFIKQRSIIGRNQ